MIRHLIVYISFLTFFIGCVKHLDFIQPVCIKGQILESDSKKPIENVNVILLAKNINNKKKTEEIIAKSDSFGIVISEFEFLWGENRTLFGGNDKEKNFEIKLSKDRYKSLQLKYNISELNDVNGKKIIDLNRVFLDKIK